MSAVIDRPVASRPVSAEAAPPAPVHLAASPSPLLRGLLFAGAVAALAAAASIGAPAAFERADPELARLLRGMAVIKAGIVVAALAVLAWRFGRPTPPRLAAAYLVGAWLVTGASMLVWQLTQLVAAGFAFHVGALVLLCVAWRDRGGRAGRTR